MIKSLVAASLFSAAYATDCPTCAITGDTLKITLDDCATSYTTYNCKANAYGNCACDCDGHYGADCKDFTINGATVVLGGTCSDDTRNPTSSPTTSPTKAPTKAPTKSPTNSPTTKAPTKAPTSSPTTSPTNSPTNPDLWKVYGGHTISNGIYKDDFIFEVRKWDQDDASGSWDAYRYNAQNSEKETGCAQFNNAEPCTHDEMTKAMEDGWSDCSCMWTASHSTTQYYPMAGNHGSGNGCGGAHAGVRTCSRAKASLCCVQRKNLNLIAGSSTAKTWSEAQAHCGTLKAHLPEPHSQEENAEIYGALASNTQTWLGFSDSQLQGQYVQNHQPSTSFFTHLSTTTAYRNWNTNEPNGGTSENCVHMYGSNSAAASKWNDLPCSSTRPFICEKPLLSGLQSAKTFWSAQDYCASNYHDGRIAAPRNSGENQNLGDLAGNNEIWIGIDDRNTEGEMIMHATKAVAWSNWNNNEPNDAGSGEDCAVLRTAGNWNDLPCTHTRKFICEYSRSSDGSTN